MSRPRTYGERVHLQARLPVELHARLQAAAQERQVSANLLVERAIRLHLDSLLPIEEALRTTP